MKQIRIIALILPILLIIGFITIRSINSQQKAEKVIGSSEARLAFNGPIICNLESIVKQGGIPIIATVVSDCYVWYEEASPIDKINTGKSEKAFIASDIKVEEILFGNRSYFEEKTIILAQLGDPENPSSDIGQTKLKKGERIFIFGGGGVSKGVIASGWFEDTIFKIINDKVYTMSNLPELEKLDGTNLEKFKQMVREYLIKYGFITE